MNYEKGEQIKSVEELIKEVLAKGKAYFKNGVLYDFGDIHYYNFVTLGISKGFYLYAIPKKERVKFWKFVTESGADSNRRYNESFTLKYEGKDIGGKAIVKEVVQPSSSFVRWTKTNCFIEVEV